MSLILGGEQEFPTDMVRMFLKAKFPRNNKIDLILIQGCTCSGKSTIGNYLYSILKGNNNIYCFSLDQYYNTIKWTDETKLNFYDFDNPNAFNWETFIKTMTGFANGDDKITISKRDLVAKTRIDEVIDNPHPDIIIIEGIYAFNIFNRFALNLPLFSPFKLPTEHPDNVWVENDLISFFQEKFNILKLRLRVRNKDVAKNIRVRRDPVKFFSKEDPELIHKAIVKRFDEMVWPATRKWIDEEINNVDIELYGGTFNLRDSEELCKEISYVLNSSVPNQSFVPLIDVIKSTGIFIDIHDNSL